MVIPEYVGNLSYTSTHSLIELLRGVGAGAGAAESAGFPTSTVAISLIMGFTFMLVVEHQFSGSHAHTPLGQVDSQRPKPTTTSSVEFDVELGDLENSEAFDQGGPSRPTTDNETPETRQRAYPLTLGLVVHALADGLALGSAAFSDAGNAATASGGSLVPSGLSIVVFIALIVHKGT